tara:strand:- start:842 stop:1162 length:321 start_codon:yes stop_codon:yes gene_type:complete
VLKALLSAAKTFGVEGDFAAISTRFAKKGFALNNDLKVVRARVNEVIDSKTDESVPQVRNGVKLTSGKVDLGMVTDESVIAGLEAKVDDLTAKFETLVALMTKMAK